MIGDLESKIAQTFIRGKSRANLARRGGGIHSEPESNMRERREKLKIEGLSRS